MYIEQPFEGYATKSTIDKKHLPICLINECQVEQTRFPIDI